MGKEWGFGLRKTETEQGTAEKVTILSENKQTKKPYTVQLTQTLITGKREMILPTLP